MAELPELPFDGERFIPGMSGTTELEHIHRYALATRIAKDKVVLDLASGEGYGSNMLAQVASRVVGVDVSQHAIAHAKATYMRTNLDFRYGSCADVPVDSDSIDLAVSFETIEHHDQHEAMMKEVGRALKSDGVLLISSPNKREYSDLSGFSNPFHVKELYQDEFLNLLQRHFSNVTLLGQRTMQASAIAQLEESARHLEHRFAEHYRESFTAISRPIYFVALASNGPLPELPNSLMEASVPRALDVPNVLVEASRLQVYWGTRDQAFSEERSASLSYPVGAAEREYALFVPACVGIDTLRIDVSDRPLVCHLKSLSLRDGEGQEVWSWNGSPDTCVRASECLFILTASGGVGADSPGMDIAVTGGDPHFEIDLGPEVSSRIADGFSLLAEFSSRRLLGSYQIDLRSLAADFTTASDQLAAQCSAAIEAMREATETLGEARREEETARAGAKEAQVRASAADQALLRAEAQLARIRGHRWWNLLNRVFRLD